MSMPQSRCRVQTCRVIWKLRPDSDGRTFWNLLKSCEKILESKRIDASQKKAKLRNCGLATLRFVVISHGTTAETGVAMHLGIQETACHCEISLDSKAGQTRPRDARCTSLQHSLLQLLQGMRGGGEGRHRVGGGVPPLFRSRWLIDGVGFARRLRSGRARRTRQPGGLQRRRARRRRLLFRGNTAPAARVR